MLGLKMSTDVPSLPHMPGKHMGNFTFIFTFLLRKDIDMYVFEFVPTVIDNRIT